MNKRYIDAYALENRVEDFERLTRMKLDIVHDFVSSQPTADVRENANGNWIKRIDHLDYGLIEFEGFECSLCGIKIWKDDYENIEFKFCPNCGAQMKEINYELETRAIN